MDREKVIAGLTMLVDRKNDDTCEGLKCCKIAEDALALLKEQDNEIAKFCGEVARLTAMLEEQKAEIRQLKLALDIVKGTCKGISWEGWLSWNER